MENTDNTAAIKAAQVVNMERRELVENHIGRLVALAKRLDPMRLGFLVERAEILGEQMPASDAVIIQFPMQGTALMTATSDGSKGKKA